MKSFAQPKALALMTLLVIGTIASAQSKSTFAVISAGNEQEFGFNSGNIALASNYNGTGGAISINHTQSFTGVDDFDQPQTMSLGASAFASAQYGILKASASATIDNTFYSSTNNPYWNPNTSTVDENGVPDFFLVAGSASYSDTFTYTGLGAGFTVNFYYQVDGWLLGDDPYTNLIVTNNGNQEIFNATPGQNGFVNQTFITEKYTPVDGKINQSVSFTSGVSSRVNEYSDGTNLSSTADFSSTVSLVGMVAYDQNGNIATGWSVESGSGTLYPVPEPATMSILGIAALAAAAKKRKKQS